MKATEVTAGLAESNGSLLPGLWRDSLHVTCGLTACTPGSAPGPTLGRKTLPFFRRTCSGVRWSGSRPRQRSSRRRRSRGRLGATRSVDGVVKSLDQNVEVFGEYVVFLAVGYDRSYHGLVHLDNKFIIYGVGRKTGPQTRDHYSVEFRPIYTFFRWKIPR